MLAEVEAVVTLLITLRAVQVVVGRVAQQPVQEALEAQIQVVVVVVLAGLVVALAAQADQVS